MSAEREKLPDWYKASKLHIEKVRSLSAGQITWQTLPSPNPDALRAYQGETPHYLMNIAQANVTDVGLVHEGMIVSKDDGLVIRIDHELASHLWHAASAGRN